eukprot:COSAG05_NODE_392_length_10391_cov_8.232899_7_plen_109_part_00
MLILQPRTTIPVWSHGPSKRIQTHTDTRRRTQFQLRTKIGFRLHRPCPWARAILHLELCLLVVVLFVRKELVVHGAQIMEIPALAAPVNGHPEAQARAARGKNDRPVR